MPKKSAIGQEKEELRQILVTLTSHWVTSEKPLSIMEIADLSGEGRAYGNIGIAYFSLGDFQKAIEYREKGLKVAKEIGDTVEEGRALLW